MTPHAAHGPVPFWRDDRVLKWIAQIISAIAVIGFVVFFVSNVLRAAQVRGLDLGFGFVRDAAGFALGEASIPYDPSMSFGRALLVGLLNTLKVALVGIVLATLLGLFTALARLSTNWLVSKIASAYIEIIRNVPLLVQLFFWYFAIFQQLPPVRQSIQLPGPAYLSQRGLYLTWPKATDTATVWIVTLLVALALSGFAYALLLRRQLNTGRSTHPGW